MGRYTTRFQGGGSNAVGATYTAAAGGGNSKFAVAANGQTLNRTDYPALSAYYSGQSQFATFNLDGVANNPTTVAIPFGQAEPTTAIYSYYGGGERAATFSGFTIHIQALQNRDNTSQRNSCIWYTTNGEDWKLTDLLSPPVGLHASFITSSSTIYLCHESGLSTSTNGLDFTGVYTTGVYGLTELNGTVIFSTGGENVLKTNDFNTFTGVNITGFQVTALANYSGTLYAFSQGTTGVRYSTDTGTTWQTATSGLSSLAGYGVKVIGGYLIASTRVIAAEPLYQYSTNPTGTTNTWTTLGVNKPSNYASYVTHYLYDSTHNVLMCGLYHQLQGSSAQGVVAYRVTGITGTSLAFSGSNTDLNFNNSSHSNWNNYPFIFQSGNTRRINIGYLCSYDPLGSGWLDTDNPYASGRIVLDGGNSGIRPNPFFRPLQWGDEGWYSLGTTNSGDRYIANCNSNNFGSLDGPVRYFALYAEESGFFKPLKATSTGEFANIPHLNNTVFSSLPSRPNLVLNEASGRYLVAWQWSGNVQVGNEAGAYYNSYLQSTRRSTGNVQKYNTIINLGWQTSLYVVGGTRSDGIYIIGTMAQGGGNDLDYLYINPTGGTAASTYRVGGAGCYPQVFFSDVDNEVIISRWTTGTVTGYVTAISGGVIGASGIYTLTNATGGVISSIGSGSAMVKSAGRYYVFDSSGNIYGGASATSLSYIKSSIGTSTLTNFNNYMVFREIGTGLIYGTLGSKVLFGTPENTFQTRTPGSYDNYGKNRAPEYFRFSGNSYYIETPGYGDPTTFTTQSGVFLVPNIVSTTTGESKYIIAR